MLNWFLDLFTLPSLGYFGLGVAATCGWHFIKARLQGRILIIRWQYIATPLVIALAAYMAVQNQQNADCIRQFQEVIRDRASVTSENDKLSQQQRALVYSWIHNLVFPPPDIAKLDGRDPRREKWAINLTLETDKQFRASLDEQRENDEYRAAHPLPPATCGL